MQDFINIELQIQNWAADMSIWVIAGIVIAVALLVFLQISMAYRLLRILLVAALLTGVVFMIANH